MIESVRATFRVSAELDLAALDPRATPIGPQDKTAAAHDMDHLATRLDELQEALYAEAEGRRASQRAPASEERSRSGSRPFDAEATGGGSRAALLVLQGIDTSGKGGVISHVAGLVNPQGVQIASFKKPTPEEREHHFLWRISQQVPAPGRIGVFDRSHYEDVLVVRVEALVPEKVWRGRYAEINAFEAELAVQDVTVVKCMLHISPQEQAQRLLARLDDPAKRWKYNPGDLDARAKWGAYQQAYADALRLCDSDAAPWYVVPSDRKWYRNWVVASLLAETLTDLDPQFPQPTIDVDAERARIRASVAA